MVHEPRTSFYPLYVISKMYLVAHLDIYLFIFKHFFFILQVCCTAIVYATDRKNTKVEFPEARIYEETLNCLLYENRNGPDQELMQATSLRVPVASYTSDDEDDRQRCQPPGMLKVS